jgi:hypothetical protein
LRADRKFCTTCGAPAAAQASAPATGDDPAAASRPPQYSPVEHWPSESVSAPAPEPDATVTSHPAHPYPPHPYPGAAAPAAAAQHQPRHISAAPIIVGVLIGAALAAAVVLVLVLMRDDQGEAAGFPGNAPAAPTTPTAASTPTPSATASAPAELLPIAAERAAVRKTLTTFFASIEAGDFETAFNMRVWELKPGVSRQDAFNRFAADHSTTTYEPDITIDNFRYDGADILIDVDFTSHQAAEMAPDGAGTCTRWSLYYRMKRMSHTWLIKDAKARSEPGYTPC